MLSGINDEVVPRDHMQGLWELVIRRGTTGDEKDQPATKERKGEGAEEGRSYKIVEDPRTMSKYVEFEAGTHSKSLPSCLFLGQTRLRAKMIPVCNRDIGRPSRSSSAH